MPPSGFGKSLDAAPNAQVGGGLGLDRFVEGALRRDRWIVLAALTVVIAASWTYLLAGASMEMPAEPAPMSGMPMAMTEWSARHAAIMFFMWWIMMVAMMLPSATPMILLFAAIYRRQRLSGNPYVSTTLFTASYLAAWGSFSLVATIAHWSLEFTGFIGADMAVMSRFVGACLLLAAGLYQLTPIKQACLTHCRMPAAYLAEHWRSGAAGAFVLGLRHGAYCIGCCWFLMLLLFVGGVMNLYWIAGLAAYILLEKTIPAGHWLDYGLGLLLAGAGAWMLLQAIFPA